MSNLEKLYYNMHILNEYYADTEETKEAQNAMESAIGEEIYSKCEDEICACMSANEKQGFIFGFQYAVSLLTSGSVATAEMKKGGRI